MVAQTVEDWPVKQMVLGSRPSVGKTEGVLINVQLGILKNFDLDKQSDD